MFPWFPRYSLRHSKGYKVGWHSLLPIRAPSLVRNTHTYKQLIKGKLWWVCKWSARGKCSRKRLIRLWGLAGSSHPSTHPMPKFSLQYSCQMINLWLNLSADGIYIRCSILPLYSIACLWAALTIKSPFFFGTEICLPTVPTSSTDWDGSSMGKQLGVVEGRYHLELEGTGEIWALTEWTVFLLLEEEIAHSAS